PEQRRGLERADAGRPLVQHRRALHGGGDPQSPPRPLDPAHRETHRPDPHQRPHHAAPHRHRRQKRQPSPGGPPPPPHPLPPPPPTQPLNPLPTKITPAPSGCPSTSSTPTPGVGGSTAVPLTDAHFADTLPSGLVIVNNGTFPAATTCTSTSGAALAFTAP